MHLCDTASACIRRFQVPGAKSTIGLADVKDCMPLVETVFVGVEMCISRQREVVVRSGVFPTESFVDKGVFGFTRR